MEDQATDEKDQATVVENIETLFDTVKEYSKTNLDLLKLKAADRSAEIVASAVAATVVIIIMIIFFAILSIGIALLLGELFGKTYYGFFALAGFYLIAGLIFNSMKEKWFKTPVANIIIKKLFK